MARKTTGSTTTTRSKKTAIPAEPAAVQVVPEVQAEARKEVRKDSRMNGKPANLGSGAVSGNAPLNLEEEIRRRAYELYLQRRATAGPGNGNGDQNQDWLIAESEVLSRYDRLARHTTA